MEILGLRKQDFGGKFNKDLPRNEVQPDPNSWIMKLGGKSERTKELRSMTPPGFAKAFFEANKESLAESA